MVKRERKEDFALLSAKIFHLKFLLQQAQDVHDEIQSLAISGDFFVPEIYLSSHLNDIDDYMGKVKINWAHSNCYQEDNYTDDGHYIHGDE